MIELMQHQKRAVELFSRRNQILAHEMGTGKTITAISIKKHKKRIVVVCPAKLRNNWAVELEKMGENSVQIIETGKDTIHGKKWLICSYSLLESLLNRLPEEYKDLIGDESHFIKGKSTRAKAFILFSRRCEHVILLTGTPIMNKPIELWNQLLAINAPITRAMTKTKYSQRYCGGKLKFIYFRGQRKPMFFNKGAGNLHELTQMIREDIDIVKKKDVLDLPEKRVISKIITMSADEKREYANAWNNYLNFLKENPEYSKEDIQGVKNAKQLVELGKLRQVTSAIKVKYLLESLEEIGEQQAIIFSEYVQTLKTLNAGLKKAGIKYSTLQDDGSVEEFQAKKTQIFTASIISGGQGLNLQNANIVFIIDEHWTPAQNIQAEDRVHRKGQDQPCSIYYLRVKDTIDEKVADINIKKRRIIDKII